MVLDKLSISDSDRTKYEFFSGKGGVGKTTLAASRVLHLSKQGKKVLVISTDPAHSLSDSFEEEIGPDETHLRENLWAVEIGPERAVEEFRDKISREDVMGEMGLGGMDGLLGGGEEEDTENLASMTPGIDEMAAFDRFMDYMHREDYDHVVFDTAPTGHTLRFLSLPDVMESWVGKLIRIKSKISKLTGAFKGFMPFAEEEKESENRTEVLEELKKRIKDARDILQDGERTRFWLVMLPQEMSLYETERTVDQLEGYGIGVEDLIVNQILPENKDCGFCTNKRRRQLEVLEKTRDRFPDMELKRLRSFREEVKGYRLLGKVGERVYG